MFEFFSPNLHSSPLPLLAAVSPGDSHLRILQDSQRHANPDDSLLVLALAGHEEGCRRSDWGCG
uniref:Uncharacterized protein n=1 Tax=Leersia perrieri TaxID=77586 RepID=A0A0D9WLH9_9ORYZ